MKFKNRRKKRPGVSAKRSKLMDKSFGQHTSELIKTHTGGRIPRKPTYDGKQHHDSARDFHKKDRENKAELDKIREENGGSLPRNPNSNKGKGKGTTALKPSSRRAVWMAHFLNESNSDTFLNKASSAIAAGYKSDNCAQIGLANYKAMQPVIDKWLDEVGLTETTLKLKLFKLLNAKETKFFSFQGEVTNQIEVDNLGIQKSAVELAAKIKGMTAPTEIKHTHQGGTTNVSELRIRAVDGPGKPVEVENVLEMKKIGHGEAK